MRVGFDLDGVLYNWHASVREYLGFDLARAPEPTSWNFHDQWGISARELHEAVMDGIDAGVVLSWGEPMPGAIETLQRIKSFGHTIHIVTDRRSGSPGAAQAATIRWLHEYGLPFDSVTFARDKTIAAVDMFLDDKIDNYDQLHAAGVDAYLLDRPWNHQDSALPNRKRVFSVEGYGDAVESRTLIAAGTL